jgi:hypothetical protein
MTLMLLIFTVSNSYSAIICLICVIGVPFFYGTLMTLMLLILTVSNSYSAIIRFIGVIGVPFLFFTPYNFQPNRWHKLPRPHSMLAK